MKRKFKTEQISGKYQSPLFLSTPSLYESHAAQDEKMNKRTMQTKSCR